MLIPNYTNSPDIRILSLTWERLTDRRVERKKNEETEDNEEAKDGAETVSVLRGEKPKG